MSKEEFKYKEQIQPVTNWFIAHYIIDRGVETIKRIALTDLEEMYEELVLAENKNQSEGKFSVFTPEYSLSLVYHAREKCINDEHMDCIANMMSQSTYITKYINTEEDHYE